MTRRRKQPPVYTTFRITDDVQGFNVRTRPKRDAGQVAVLLFISVWLCGWAFGEVFALSALVGTIGEWFATPPVDERLVEADPSAPQPATGGVWAMLGSLPIVLFLLVWLTGWTFGGAIAMRFVVSLLVAGQEAIFTADELTLRDRPFGKAVTYPLRELKKMRVASQEPGWSVCWEHGGEKVRLGVFRRPQDAAELMNAIAQRSRTLAGQ